MSLMGMRRVVKQYGTPIWIALALTLVVGSFVGFGSYLFGENPASQAAAEPPIAVVGDAKITRSALDRTLSQFSANPSPQEIASTRLFLLEQAKQQQAVVAAAKRAGITVTEDDLERAREAAWAQQRVSYISALGLKEGASDDELDRALARINRSVDDFKQQFAEEDLRASVYAQKLQEKFKKEAQAKATEQAVRNSYQDIQVRHILIKFGEGALPEEQARAKAQKILDAVKADPSKMPQLARENSDDPGSKANGGFYDWAPASRYVPAFTAAAQAVKPGQVYPELVRVANPGYSGFHIVKLEGSRPGTSMPKDFEKNKQKYIDQYAEMLAQQMAQEAVAAALPDVKVTINDPTLRAAQLQQEANRSPDPKTREAKLNAALAELGTAKEGDDAIVTSMRASLYEALGKTREAIAAHTESLKYRNSLQTRLALAQLHLKNKNKPAAIKELQAAEELVLGDIPSQAQIASLYKQAGRADLAAAADKKYLDLQKRQAELNKAAAPTNFSLPADKNNGKKPGG